MIRFATSRPAVVWAMCVALLLAGALAFMRLPLATRTTVELPRLSVNAVWPGVAPEVIEAYLTAPMEAAVQGVRGVKRISSVSSDGVAALTVSLEERADVQMTRLAILERLDLLRTEFPPGVSPPSVSNHVPEGFEELPLLSLLVFGPYTPGTLQRLLNEQVSPKLAGVPGVSGVAVRGGSDLGIAVTYDASRLRQLTISPASLRDALGSARLVQSLGSVTRNVGSVNETVQAVVLRDEPGTLDELAQLPIVAPGGRVFPLGQLASIRAEEDSRGRFFRIDGEPAVALDVTRSPGADAIRTAAALRAAVAELQSSLPTGVRLQVANDESVDLARDLRDLARRGAIAFVCVLLVLLLLLRNARAAAVVMGTTAVALTATALTLFIFGIPANLLTLAGMGMGVGVLVQNAVIVVERLTLAPDTPDGRAGATQRIAPAVLGGTLTTAVVLFPFLYLQGNARAAFVPFALAFVVALVWSVFTSLCVVPTMARGQTARRAQWMWATRAYRWVVRGLLRWRWLTLTAGVAVLAVMTWAFIEKVPRSSFNWFGGQRTTLAVTISFPRGSDPATLDQAMRDFETIATSAPEVEQVRSESRTPISASMRVLFTRAGGWTSAPLIMQEQLTQRAVLVGGANISVIGEGPAFSSGGGGGSFSNFRIQVRGFAYDGVSEVANDLKARLERIPRVRDVRITSGGWGRIEQSFQVTLEPDRHALRRYGVSAEAFTNAVAREVRGPVGAQRVVIGGEELPVTLKAAGARDRSLAELQDARLPTSSGAPVRIGDVSVVAEQEALSTVVREDQQYVRQANYDFRGPPRLANRTHTAFVKSLTAPPGYAIIDQSSGSGFTQDESVRGLWLVFGIGVALVVLAVALVFDSVWGAAQVFLSLPLALAGVVAAFWMTDTAFTREAAVGVILVVGLAVNQSILLVDAALEQRQRTGSLHAGQVLRAALDRSGMIVMVTFAALASLIPLSVGAGSDTLFGAIALATAGGTVAGTIGAMFFLPAMLVGHRQSARRRWRFGRRRPHKD
ncbi:MAG TPA: efflux RND transporter permease subunit [Gemmatimonas sp.]|uniref:efflux RND transporter permease subunit n=1 Tax=Gemmatimonas sp. TaxID=1962908 RepID=UPI002EDAB93F